jgi:hypothetical protein
VRWHSAANLGLLANDHALQAFWRFKAEGTGNGAGGMRAGRGEKSGERWGETMEIMADFIDCFGFGFR